MDGQVMIYETGGKNVKFNFRPEEETIWATQAQMAELFSVAVQTIGRHLKGIYAEGELEESRTCTKNVQVEMEGGREVSRVVKMYSLDAIISVGYRVNSRKATDFRIWATKVLRQYIVNGAAVNERRLTELSRKKLVEVNETFDVVRRLMAQRELTGEDANGVLAVITQYAGTFRTLKEYDEGFVRLKEGTKTKVVLEAEKCMKMVRELKRTLGAGEMFGRPRGKGFEGILRTIHQSFAGEEMYSTVEEKAANLLYFIIKDHPFFDGNKRIAALMFMMFLAMNEQSLRKNGEAKISDRALTALTLMIAESEPREKGLMCAVVCRLLEE